MSYSVELYFDQVSENKIREYLNIIKQAGIDNLFYNLNSSPHISLAVYNDNLNYSELINDLEDFSFSRIKIHFENIGFFCSNEHVIFLSPKVNYNLLDIHKNYHKKFKKYIKNEWKYYLPVNWIPHCTMAFEMNNDNFINTIKILKDNFIPIDVIIEKIGIIKFRPIEKLYLKDI